MIIKYSEMFESKKDKFPNYREVIIDDFTIYIGKDSKSNDYLTLNIAKDDDMWFHAKGVPGSHVVLVVGDKVPSIDVIKKVAFYAKKNSKGKDSDECPVVYCKRKFVKKNPGMNDGQVTVDYKNASDVIV